MLHSSDPLIPLTTDKIDVRDWVAERVGSQILVPLYGVWECASDVPWQSLPTSFVLKASHGWNMNLLVHDKAKLDREAAMATAATWLQTDHYHATLEWGYHGLQPRLLAEKLLIDQAGKIPADLKFHVFDGRVQFFEAHTDRFNDHRTTYYNRDGRALPFTHIYPPVCDWSPPVNLAELIDIAECLGAEFDYVRVDLYSVSGMAYFGELTHYQGSACLPFVPADYDRIVGDLWRLRVDEKAGSFRGSR